MKLPNSKRMLASAALVLVGFAIAAVGIQLLVSFPSIYDSLAFSLYFLGGTLIGAGALCPFGRVTAGSLTGFIVAGYLAMTPIRTAQSNANETFARVAEQLGAAADASVDRSDASSATQSQLRPSD